MTQSVRRLETMACFLNKKGKNLLSRYNKMKQVSG